MSTGTPEVKPEVSFIFELLQELAEGRIRIPGFQRPYVWRRDQMLDLLDSVHLQYPIGNILLWETNERYRTLDWVGPLRVPEPKASTALILDGQQRLSTLAGVLLPLAGSETNPRDDDPWRWEIWFNARGAEGTGSFEHPAENAPMEAWHFPMRKLMDTIAFLEECQRIITKGHEHGIEWINRIQRLAKVFQSYKISVTRIKNTNLEQAVEIFARLNSKGQRMSADQIVSALVYTESPDEEFDLSRHIDELHSHLVESDFGDVDRTTLLRLVLACLGEDVYRTDWTKIAREKRPNIKSMLAAEAQRTGIRQSLTRAVDFLRGCGVHHERLLPYAMQLVVLTGFFHRCPNPSETQHRFVQRWFWVSSFTGWGGQGNPSRVGGLVKEFSKEVAENIEPRDLRNMQLDKAALPFPKNFDMRSARVRALLLVLLSKKPAGRDGKSIHEPWRLIGQYGPEAIGYVLHRMKDRDLVSSPANRILKPDLGSDSQAPGSRGAQAKGWLSSLDDSVRDDVLESHAIPTDAYEALLENDHAQFIQRRQEYMIKLELSFMEKEDVVPPGNAMAPQLSPIDTDDDIPLLPPNLSDIDE